MFDKNFRVFLGFIVFIIIGFIFYSNRLSRDLEGIAFFDNAIKPIRAAQSQKKDVSSLKNVKLSLLASALPYKGNVYTAKKGDVFSIDVVLAPGDTYIDGIDARISYNPSILEVVKVDTASSVFSAFPSNSIDEKKGMVSFAALSAPNTSVDKNGNVASLLVKALTQGISPVAFVFTPNNSTDTNAAEHGTGRDALENVENISITIL